MLSPTTVSQGQMWHSCIFGTDGIDRGSGHRWSKAQWCPCWGCVSDWTCSDAVGSLGSLLYRNSFTADIGPTSIQLRHFTNAYLDIPVFTVSSFKNYVLLETPMINSRMHYMWFAVILLTGIAPFNPIKIREEMVFQYWQLARVEFLHWVVSRVLKKSALECLGFFQSNFE